MRRSGKKLVRQSECDWGFYPRILEHIVLVARTTTGLRSDVELT